MNNSINPNENQFSEDEISLFDIIQFFIENWIQIIGFGIVGIIGAGLFLMLTPAQYEATAQIQMAQISSSRGSNKNINPLGENIEEPSLLIARMKLPSSYDQATTQVCIEKERLAHLKESDAVDLVSKIVKMTALKGVTSVVELKLSTTNRELSIACAVAVYESIKKSQQHIADPFITEAQEKIDQKSKRLDEAKRLITKADGSGAALSAAYLSTRDEIKFLTDEISELEDFIAAGKTRHTKLVSPIYSPEKPIFPKKTLSLVAGLFGGLFIGLLITLIRKWFKSYKSATTLKA